MQDTLIDLSHLSNRASGLEKLTENIAITSPMSYRYFAIGILLAFTKTRRFVVFAIILAMSCVLSCTPNENKAIAERAVLDFHQQLIDGHYHDIYAASDPEFRKAMSESDATALFTAVNTKLGQPKNSDLKNWRVDLLVNGTFVTLVYQTEFTKAGAQEEFVWHIQGNRPILFRYSINSLALVTK